MRDPAPAPNRRRLLVALAVGALAALIAVALAPADWEPGPGAVQLDYLGAALIEDPIAVGTIEPVTVAGGDGDLQAEVTFPNGVPVDAEVEAWIAFEEGGSELQADLGDVALWLTLPDDRRELIPILRWDADQGLLEALRRPTQDAAVVLGLLGFAVVLWVSEALPLFVTSLLIPVVLVFSGVAGPVAATAPFFNPIIVLFFAGFLMAEAMRRTGLDHFVAVTITARASRSAAVLFATMLSLGAFLSMWMSNTAATAVLVPIAVAVSAPLGHIGYQRALVLGLAYAATIGGVGSAIGTPANQLAIEFLDSYGGRSISFVEWFAFGVPMVVLFLPLMGWYVWKRSDVRVDPAAFAEARAVAEEERRSLGAPGKDQMVVLGVFALVAVGWLTQTFHGIHPGIVALAGAIALFVLGELLPEDLGRISWAALITFGGGLTLGLFLVETGTSDYLATRLTGLDAVGTTLAVLAVAALTLVLTMVASNTASAAILIPLAIPLAAVLGIDPTLLVVVVAIASSIDFALVIGTPPTMIAYATGLYTAGRIFRTGIALDVAGIVLLVLVVTRIWEMLGVL